jgi:uncharacterized membrane protein YoaK (UPF0700 family)
MCWKNLNKWFEKKIKKIDIWDFALIKTTLIIAGIIIGAYITDFVKEFVWYWVALFVLFYVWMLMILHSKK